MSRTAQSKAQTELNARTLRSLVKQLDNKTCADCKRNDPRWASWNIGAFLCIRCSGIHRSMGTHISKVKSIDLDIWTPEQMESIQKWGNKRVNLYWEAHLKAGHVPPEHKVESFIRSKYETRRWAKEGQPPSDPAVLEASSTPAAAAPAAAATSAKAAPSSSSSRSAPAPTPAPLPTAIDLLGGDPTPAPAIVGVTAPRQSFMDDEPATGRSNPPPTRTSAAPAPTPATSAKAAGAAAAQPAKAGGGGGGLFDLDWHDPPAPAQISSLPPLNSSRGKSDILSLFGAPSASSSTVRPPPTQTMGAGASNAAFGGLDGSFGGTSIGSSVPSTATSIRSPSISYSGAYGGGTSTNLATQSSTSTTGSSNPWAASNAPAAASGLFASSDVWAGGGGGAAAAASTTSPQQNKGVTTTGAGAGGGGDIWGDFTTSSTPIAVSASGTAADRSTVKDDPFGDIWK